MTMESPQSIARATVTLELEVDGVSAVELTNALMAELAGVEVMSTPNQYAAIETVLSVEGVELVV